MQKKSNKTLHYFNTVPIYDHESDMIKMMMVMTIITDDDDNNNDDGDENNNTMMRMVIRITIINI